MSQPFEDWQPTFDAVHNVPGSTKQQPAKKTVQALQEEAERNRRRQVADVAVGLGAVDTGDDFDPWDWLSFWSGERITGEAETAADIIALDGRVTALEGGGVVTTYTVSGTWTNPTPAEHNPIQVICINGGDGGSRGVLNLRDTIKGGQSGGYMQKTLFTDEISSTVAMTIGSAGAGATSFGRGGTGAVTSFGTYVVGLKGVGAIFRDGAYSTGIPPGDGGNGAVSGGHGATDFAMPSTNGHGGPFAPGGLAGFGSSSSAVNGRNGTSPPANIPSGGGGGGGGSAYNTLAGAGGNGAFPGGGGGGGGLVGSNNDDGGDGGAGCIFVITTA